MTLQRFAEEHRLRVSRDECRDHIIRGKRGHLYVDGGVISAMWISIPPLQDGTLPA